MRKRCCAAKLCPAKACGVKAIKGTCGVDRADKVIDFLDKCP